MASPTCGPRRMSVCSARGMPLKFCRPLSTPPMREPRPPASTTPVICDTSVMTAGAVRGPRETGFAGPLKAPPRGGGAEGASGGAKLPADVAHLDTALSARGVGRHRAAQLRIAVAAALPDVGEGRGELGV